jgi:hypothetical protein
MLARAAVALGSEPLRGQWHLDEARAHPDSSGNGLTATDVGNPLPDSRWGGSLFFRTSGEDPRAGDQPLLQPATVTLLAWVRDSTPASGPIAYRDRAARQNGPTAQR